MIKQKSAFSSQEEAAISNNKKNKEKTINLAISASILAVSVLIFLFVLFIEPDAAVDVNEDTYNTYLAFDNSLIRLEADYLNTKGFVSKNQVDNLLNSVEKELKQGISSGIVDFYNRESDNIYIKYTSGVKSVFVPHMERMLSSGSSSKILCVEPEIINNRIDVNRFESYINKKFKKIKYNGLYSVSSNAKFIQENKKGFVKSSLVNSQVSIDNLKAIGSESIIIFEGHGVYNKLTDSCLVTGEAIESWNDIEQYKDDIEEGSIIFTAFPEKDTENNTYHTVRQLTVTSKFFDKYLSNMNDTLVFLGACCSNKSDALANSFLSKGASAVVGYSERISLEYEVLTRTMFFNNFCKDKKTTVNNALKLTQKVTKSYDPWSKQKSPLLCYSRDDMGNLYTLSGVLKPTNSKKNNAETTSTVNIPNTYHVQESTTDPVYDAPYETTPDLDNPESYKEYFIKCLVEKERLWKSKSSSDKSVSSFAFMDLDFDGKPEFIVRDIGTDSNYSNNMIYTLKNGMLTSVLPDTAIDFDLFKSSSTPYYNFNTGKYIFLSSNEGDDYCVNFTLQSGNEQYLIDIYSRYDVNEDENGDKVVSYYKCNGLSQNKEEISRYEYDSLNCNVKSDLRELNVKYKLISFDTYDDCTQNGKEALLESSYNAFSYN